MKKANVALSFAARMARLLPLLFCLVLFSSTDVLAQDYKTLDEATVAVKDAYSELLSQQPQNFSDATTDTEARVTMRVYREFLDIADASQSVQTAAERVQEKFEGLVKKKNSGNPREQIIANALEDLEELITQ